MSVPCYVTTMDNIHNPFTDYERWNNFDVEHKYYTNEWLSIFSKDSVNLDEEGRNLAIDDAINRFLDLNPYGIHYKIYEDEADTIIPLANKAYNEVNATLHNNK